MTDHILNELVGKRMRIVGDHPHSGCHGEIVRIEETPFGMRPVLRFDEPHLGIRECFIMSSKHAAREIGKKKKDASSRNQ